jgi:hypothetical protein
MTPTPCVEPSQFNYQQQHRFSIILPQYLPFLEVFLLGITLLGVTVNANIRLISVRLASTMRLPTPLCRRPFLTIPKMSYIRVDGLFFRLASILELSRHLALYSRNRLLFSAVT